MAANIIHDILGYQHLGPMFRAVASGVPDVLPDSFKRISRQVVGDSISYTRRVGQRKTARRVERNSPSVKREMVTIGDFPVKMPTFKEHVDMDVDTFTKLRASDSYAIDASKREAAEQAAEFKQLFDNNRLVQPLSILANGKVWFDSNGYMLHSSSGAALTIDFGMNANNQGSINSIISAPWSTTSTDIPLHVRKIKKVARQTTGWPLKYAFYGENIPTYLAKNDHVKDWVIRNPRFNNAWLEAGGMELPEGLLGLTWIPVYESFFVDSGDTVRELFGVDAVVMTPEPSLDWWEGVEGSYPVPKEFGPATDIKSLINMSDQEFGMASYATLSPDAPTARLHYQDVFMYLLKNPDAIYQLDTTP